ncbi:hypothetical protein SDC9_52211 [bioreactor metagenome]|uniref:Uncharacterized protein n=1 Tax=bioreactor metagenome TaxID=1076179 RepID=A0A644WPT4_9ZZZZ
MSDPMSAHIIPSAVTLSDESKAESTRLTSSYPRLLRSGQGNAAAGLSYFDTLQAFSEIDTIICNTQYDKESVFLPPQYRSEPRCHTEFPRCHPE